MYEILTGVYDKEVSLDVLVLHEDSRTREHPKKLFKERARLEKRKNLFCNTVVDNWNALATQICDTIKDYANA